MQLVFRHPVPHHRRRWRRRGRHPGATAVLVRGWAELLRVRASIDAGAVAPSTILRKLAAAGPNNALSQALRALGRIERTLFTLQWLSEPAPRQRSHAGLNKGEASNALRRAAFFHRQGEFRDRTFENQSLYPPFQDYFRTRQAPPLAIWGRNDPFFLPAGAEAYRRDDRNAEVVLLDAGHFALESNGPLVAAAVMDFFERVLR